MFDFATGGPVINCGASCEDDAAREDCLYVTRKRSAGLAPGLVFAAFGGGKEPADFRFGGDLG